MKKLAFQIPYNGDGGGGIEITDPLGGKFGTIGAIITALLPSVYILAGLLLFIYLIIGGFGLLTSGGDPKAVESAKGKITNAVVGFIIIFVSYWLVQILEIIFGITILG